MSHEVIGTPLSAIEGASSEVLDIAVKLHSMTYEGLLTLLNLEGNTKMRREIPAD